MKVFLKLAAAGAALALGLSAQAAAASEAIVTATYTGSVTGTGLQGDTGAAFDQAGVFGGLANLDAQSFTATFVFDTRLGARLTAPGVDALFSGDEFGLPSGFLSANLTIEGVTHGFQSDLLGAALVVTDGVHNATQHEVQSDFDFLVAGLQNPDLPLDLTAPFSGDYRMGDPLNPTLGEFLVADGVGNPAAHGYLLADHLTISSVAVPEPAGWSLMLLGFGGLGAALRATRRRAVA